MNFKGSITVFLIGTLFFCISCGGGEKKQTETISNVKTSQGADPSVSAELGGSGFEKIAKKLGYETYVISKDEQIYFGDPRAKKGGVLKHITTRFPATLRMEGQNSNYVENSEIQYLCYETLLETHPLTYEANVPRLATHWKIADDNMQFWYRINPNARWSDGRRVTSEDVVATWDLLMDETILFPSLQVAYGKFERPVAESMYIVSVKSKTKNFRNFLYFSASMYIMPSHYIKDLDGSDYLEKYQFKMLPFSGAYALYEDDIVVQESYTLTRRDDWWGKDLPQNRYRFNFDKIYCNVVKDNIPLTFEKFKKGEADFFEVSQARVWTEDCNFESIQKGWVKKHRIFSEKPAGTSGYDLNMQKWPFNDKRVRYAFGYLYDREKMNREMYYNEYDMMHSFFHGSVYENPNNPKLLYNPEKAVQLLNAAGYTEKNEEGILLSRDGKPLSFEIPIQKGYDYMVTPVQQMLREFGIDMQIQFMDGNTIWKNVMDKNFTIHMHSMTGGVIPNPEAWFKSELADQKDNINFWGFKSDRVDELLKEYDMTFERGRRIEIVREIDGIVNDAHPLSFGIARNYRRLLFWDKFGYPEYMVNRYGGNYASIFDLWWYAPEQDKRLQEATENDTPLPVGDLDIRYWPDYLIKHNK